MSKKIKLSLNMRHGGTSFRLGKHKITKTPAEYELDQAEVLELGSPGPQKWLVVHEAAKKKTKRSERAE